VTITPEPDHHFVAASSADVAKAVFQFPKRPEEEGNQYRDHDYEQEKPVISRIGLGP